MYFDNFEIKYEERLIVQENHYDPWGLNLAGIETQSNPNHKFQFLGQEKQDEFNLNWVETFFRSYDPQLGRFHQIDLLSDFFTMLSPYVYSYNNPITYSDPTGLAGEEAEDNGKSKRAERRRERKWKREQRRAKHDAEKGKDNQTYITATGNSRDFPFRKKIKEVKKIKTKLPETKQIILAVNITSLPTSNDGEDDDDTPTNRPDDKPDVEFRKTIITSGETYSFDERINFKPNTDKFADPDEVVSKKLDDLVNLLINHPNVKVLIAGNGIALSDGNQDPNPDLYGHGKIAMDRSATLNGNPSTAKQVLTARARAVYNFLIKQKGVSKTQLIYGPGNVLRGTKPTVSFEIRNPK
ncbi:RHS repeat-associated core domain-containing protein [Cytophagaceae bacterium DM2B3-1]|uniref:RHS repeat-associated core domain-containing protein n=1 Tax=Xanthocytophaga flava TaxID=3048013 RepID=A0ABT7CGJ5_9BACT|nr:RHS repeat-associated core domain-containing protein [Xanthocytophaga flavus]MDJ1492869.1 RHS repeat-associated core domain-containing protein [Xanthocytophaga flavus]